MFFRKKAEKRTFDGVLTLLRSQGFDVSPAGGGASGAYRVAKYGCAAEIAPPTVDTAADKGLTTAPAMITAHAGYLLKGQIARLENRGYQIFVKAGRLEIAATADILRAIHQFEEEVKQAVGATSLYNESLGTTSDTYVYDRVKGREHHGGSGGEPRTPDPLLRSTAVATTGEDGANDL